MNNQTKEVITALELGWLSYIYGFMGLHEYNVCKRKCLELVEENEWRNECVRTYHNQQNQQKWTSFEKIRYLLSMKSSSATHSKSLLPSFWFSNCTIVWIGK